MAVVFTSSRDGGRCRGAVGSPLWIDAVEVVCREPLAGEQ
ncbi:PCMD domain-containing protein [Alistipes ihumii]